MQSLLHLAAFCYSAFIAFMLLFVQPFPILHDYLEWMYQGWLLGEILGGHIDNNYQLAAWPVPNSLTQFAVAAAAPWVGPVVAGKIWLAGYLVLTTLCSYVAARRCWPQSSGAIHVVLMFTVFFGPGFWNGYSNFQYGLALFLLWWLIDSSRDSRHGLWLLVFSVLIFFAHAVPFVVLITYVGLKFLCRHELPLQRRLKPLMALLPALGLLGWYSAIKLSATELHSEASLGVLQWFQYKVYTVAKQGPFHNFVLADGSSLLTDWHALYLAGFIVNMLVVLCIALWLFSVVTQAFTQRLSVAEGVGKKAVTTAALFVVLMCVCYLLPAQKTVGVVNLGERFLIAGLLVALLVFSCPRYVLNAWCLMCLLAGAYSMAAITAISRQDVAVVKSASAAGDAIYANSVHKFFNHRVFIYADRGRFLMADKSSVSPPQPDAELATGPLILRQHEP